MLMRPCAVKRPFAHASIQPSQRRHALLTIRTPITAPAEGSGEPARRPSGEGEEQRPADRRHTRHRGGVSLRRMRKRRNRHGAPAGRVRGSAPQIGDIPDLGEVRSSTTPAALASAAQACAMVAGLRAPHPRAGPAPPPRTGRGTPVTPAWAARIGSDAPQRMPSGAAHAQEQAYSRLSCLVASSPHAYAAMRCQTPVRACLHPTLAAEACATDHTHTNHRTCGGVWGTGTAPQRGG
jgi:hypothetical protein